MATISIHNQADHTNKSSLVVPKKNSAA
jgi:hypothetical protein